MTVSGAGVASGGGGAGGGAGGDKGSGGASTRGSSTGRAWANLARLLALFCSCSLSRSRSRRRRSCSSRALCCCCACHSRKRAASSSVSMLIAPRAAGGAPGPRLRPASQAQVRLAGRQEGGITSGGRQGWAEQRTPQERTGEHGEKNQCLQNICKIKICKLKKILMQKIKKAHCLLPSFFLFLSSDASRPAAPGVPPTRKGFATRWRGGTDTHNKGRSRAAPGRRPRYYTGAAAKARTGAPARRAAASH